MTYSIVAFDADTTQWGVAVASKAMCVGAHVPWGAGSVGAVATQAYHDLRYGFEGLRALRGGCSADEVVAALTTDDPESVFRQLGVVDAAGRAATFTGDRCTTWAGGLSGDSWAVQGNILAGPHVVEAMADAYTGASGPFAERLLTTLLAGDESGGDRRGRQSAAVKIWSRPLQADGDRRDVSLFLRVDDAELPVHDLQRIVDRVLGPDLVICSLSPPCCNRSASVLQPDVDEVAVARTSVELEAADAFAVQRRRLGERDRHPGGVLGGQQVGLGPQHGGLLRRRLPPSPSRSRR